MARLRNDRKMGCFFCAMQEPCAGCVHREDAQIARAGRVARTCNVAREVRQEVKQRARDAGTRIAARGGSADEFIP